MLRKRLNINIIQIPLKKTVNSTFQLKFTNHHTTKMRRSLVIQKKEGFADNVSITFRSVNLLTVIKNYSTGHKTKIRLTVYNTKHFALLKFTHGVSTYNRTKTKMLVTHYLQSLKKTEIKMLKHKIKQETELSLTNQSQIAKGGVFNGGIFLVSKF